MRAVLQGVDGHRALFDVDGTGVVVNTRTLCASAVDLNYARRARAWAAPRPGSDVTSWSEVARCASTEQNNDVTVLAAGHESRAFTVPKAVQDEARRGLAWRKERGNGGTAVSLHVARILSSGAQVTLRDVRHVARFFSAHDDGLTASGWNPGEFAYPLSSRVTWALWGGDAARTWSQQITERLPRTASADTDVNLLAFYSGNDDERSFHAEQDPADGESVLALYTQTPDRTWKVWTNGDWADCSTSDVGDNLVELDDDTAVFVGSSLYDFPDRAVSLRAYDPEEWDLHRNSLSSVDWELVNRTLTAAGERPGQNGSRRDGNYTPDERSENTQSQPRDANGRFASVGDTGTMNNGQVATVIAVNPKDGSLVVRDLGGKTYQVMAKDFEIGATHHPGPPGPPAGGPLRPLDLSRILGQPRVSVNTPKAWLNKLLPPMNAAAIKKVLNNYSAFILNERQKYASRFKYGTGWGDVTKKKLWSSLPPNYELPDNTPTIRPAANDGEPYRGTWGTPGGPTSYIKKKMNRTAAGGLEPPLAVTDVGTGQPTGPDADKLDPETSDVTPLHLAIVDREDPRAVIDLVALVPENGTSTESAAFRRVAGQWVEDAKVMTDLRSPTPPAVVQLDDATYADVLAQVDAAGTEGAADEKAIDKVATPAAPASTPPAAPAAPATAPVAAAGGADRNRGGAEKLREYWLHGKGAAKIRWGTGGDWTRCYRHLAKYMGPRAKGYCALRHKEATGMWPGDRRNRQGLGASGVRLWESTQFLKPYHEVITASIDAARMDAARRRIMGEAGVVPVRAEQVEGERRGAAFKIPLVIPEGVESGDGRKFTPGSLRIRDLPIPLLWQLQTGEGHNGSVLIGRIERIERTPEGLGNAFGVMDTGPYGAEAERLIREGMLRWVSADLDQFEAKRDRSSEAGEEHPEEDEDEIKPQKMNINKGRLMAATVVSKPAFQQCQIELIPEEEVPLMQDGTYVGEPQALEAAALVAAGSIAMRIPVHPPRSWFENPRLTKPSPLSVTDDGQVFGHVASWDIDHIGMSRQRAPRSSSNYAYFHTGLLKTDDSSDVPVGQLTLAGGHADLTADAALAVKHYDDTGSAIADVHAGEDAYGIWVAGALRPGTTPEQIRTLRASAPSGDWRVINGRLEMVAVCQVNVPGFPIPQTQVASGQVFAMVAAGAATLARLQVDPMLELNSRLARLEEHENKRDLVRAASARRKLNTVLNERKESAQAMSNLAASARERVYLAMDVDGYLKEFKDFSDDKRKKLASEKKALPDGSFPIENLSDLRRAIQAHGRTTDEKKAAVRRHIVRRARALGKAEAIPSSWKEAALSDIALTARDARETLTAAAAARDTRELTARRIAIAKRVKGS